MTHTIYSAPGSEPKKVEESSRFGPVLVVIGCIFFILFLFDVFVGIIKIIQVASLFEAGDPKLLAGGFSAALVNLNLAVIWVIPGIIAYLIGSLKYKYRKRWAYWIAVSTASGMAVVFPVGTIISIPLLIFLIKSKNKFYQK